MSDICPRCRRPLPWCVCAAFDPVELPIRLLILRHPQESAAALGTAPLLAEQVRGTRLVTGLSWPNLAKALGEVTAEPSRWASLYLGGKAETKPTDLPLLLLDRKGAPVADQAAAKSAISGLILLDGSWAEAKALWWRNPWLLKSPRLKLNPRRPSLYGTLRREPRREGLSTLEAAAFALAELTGDPSLFPRLTAPLALLVQKAKG